MPDLHSGPANVSPADEHYEPVEGERGRGEWSLSQSCSAMPSTGRTRISPAQG